MSLSAVRLISRSPTRCLLRAYSSIPPRTPPVTSAQSQPHTSSIPLSSSASASSSPSPVAPASSSGSSSEALSETRLTAQAQSPETSKVASSKPTLTLAEQDALAHQAMLDRDGGSSSLQLEDGQYFGMKRNVKDNMFRLM